MYLILCVTKTLQLRSLCSFEEYDALLQITATILCRRLHEFILQIEERPCHLPRSSPAAKPRDQDVNNCTYLYGFSVLGFFMHVDSGSICLSVLG